MGAPLSVPGGEITDYDADTITVTPLGGAPILVARSAAPAYLQTAVSAAEGAGQQQAPVAPTGPTANPMAFIEGAPQVIEPPPAPTPAPPTRLQQSFADLRASQQPQAPSVPSVVPAGPTPEQDLEAAVQQVAASMPATGGGGPRVRTTTQRTAYDPETVAQANELQTSADVAAEDAGLAHEEGAAAESKAAGEISQVAGQQAQQLDAMTRQQQADNAEYARRFEAEQTKLKSLQVEADTQIDPKRWWKEKSTGENILAALAMGLGAMGSSITGAPNYAYMMIDKAIDRDIDAQLANRDSKYKQAAAQQDVIALVGKHYDTKEQQRQAARIMMQDSAAKYIEQITARSTQETTRAKGAEYAAALRQQSAKEAQSLTLQLAGQTTTSQTQLPGGGAGAGSKAARDAAAREAVYGKYDPAALIPGAERIFGVPMQASAGKEDAKELSKQVAAANDLLRTLDQMDALSRGGKLSPQARTSMESLRAQALLQAKEAHNLGALDAGGQQVIGEMLGPKGTDITTITTALPGLKTNTRASLRNNLASRAVRADPQRVPLAHRSRYTPGGGQTTGGAPPPTRPLSE